MRSARWLIATAAALFGLVGMAGGATAAPAPIRALSVTRLFAADTQGVRIDRIMYTNDGLTLEALAVLPTRPATGPSHPILVVLHGGFALDQPYVTHYPLGLTAASLVQLALRYPQAIVLAPEYRGYMLSGGHPGMLEASASDTRAAIRIAVRDLHGDGHGIYLLGYAMGGGVAFALAGQMPGIRAVVGVSPFVGYDIEFAWDKWEGRTGRDQPYGKVRAIFQEETFCTHFGGEPTQMPRVYAAQSPDAHIARITAPVLLLQGTADVDVLWQATREFANKLAHAGKRVRFVLYPGGPRGLHTSPYQAESDVQIFAWFARAGLG